MLNLLGHCWFFGEMVQYRQEPTVLPNSLLKRWEHRERKEAEEKTG